MAKRGLESLGKQSGVVRGMPPPANLPYFLSESSGQEDPNVRLVPIGGRECREAPSPGGYYGSQEGWGRWAAAFEPYFAPSDYPKRGPDGPYGTSNGPPRGHPYPSGGAIGGGDHYLGEYARHERPDEMPPPRQWDKHHYEKDSWMGAWPEFERRRRSLFQPPRGGYVPGGFSSTGGNSGRSGVDLRPPSWARHTPSVFASAAAGPDRFYSTQSQRDFPSLEAAADEKKPPGDGPSVRPQDHGSWKVWGRGRMCGERDWKQGEKRDEKQEEERERESPAETKPNLNRPMYPMPPPPVQRMQQRGYYGNYPTNGPRMKTERGCPSNFTGGYYGPQGGAFQLRFHTSDYREGGYDGKYGASDGPLRGHPYPSGGAIGGDHYLRDYAKHERPDEMPPPRKWDEYRFEKDRSMGAFCEFERESAGPRSLFQQGLPRGSYMPPLPPPMTDPRGGGYYPDWYPSQRGRPAPMFPPRQGPAGMYPPDHKESVALSMEAYGDRQGVMEAFPKAQQIGIPKNSAEKGQNPRIEKTETAPRIEKSSATGNVSRTDEGNSRTLKQEIMAMDDVTIISAASHSAPEHSGIANGSEALMEASVDRQGVLKQAVKIAPNSSAKKGRKRMVENAEPLSQNNTIKRQIQKNGQLTSGGPLAESPSPLQSLPGILMEQKEEEEIPGTSRARRARKRATKKPSKLIYEIGDEDRHQLFCKECSRYICKQPTAGPGTVDQCGVLHALTHLRNVFLFNCTHCGFHTNNKNTIKHHCWAKHALEWREEEVSKETKKKVVELVKKCYPKQRWSGKHMRMNFLD